MFQLIQVPFLFLFFLPSFTSGLGISQNPCFSFLVQKTLIILLLIVHFSHKWSITNSEKNLLNITKCGALKVKKDA